MLRAAMDLKTPLGAMAKRSMESGKLVPDDVVIEIIRERLKQADCREGYILDGFPRTVAQAEALEKIMAFGNRRIDAVINFSIGREELIARLTGRRLCQKCGTAFHLMFAPPAKDEVCDRCQSQLYQRDDDKEETITRRLKVYRDQTRPLTAYYLEKKVLKEVDGNGNIKTVMGRITDALGMNGI